MCGVFFVVLCFPKEKKETLYNRISSSIFHVHKLRCNEVLSKLYHNTFSRKDRRNVQSKLWLVSEFVCAMESYFLAETRFYPRWWRRRQNQQQQQLFILLLSLTNPSKRVYNYCDNLQMWSVRIMRSLLVWECVSSMQSRKKTFLFFEQKNFIQWRYSLPLHDGGKPKFKNVTRNKWNE